MAYVSEWKSLSEATARVVEATRLSEAQAKTDICQAIADRAIGIRAHLKNHATRHTTSGAVLTASDLDVPANLKPSGLDWGESRPLKPWVVRRGSFAPPGYWVLSRIEVSKTDVMNVLCAKERCDPTLHTASEAPTGSTSRPAPDRREIPSGSGSGAIAPTRRRGARPMKFERTKDAMKQDVEQGRRTLAELADIIEKELAAIYEVSRDTARRARKAVLSEFGEH